MAVVSSLVLHPEIYPTPPSSSDQAPFSPHALVFISRAPTYPVQPTLVSAPATTSSHETPFQARPSLVRPHPSHPRRRANAAPGSARSSWSMDVPQRRFAGVKARRRRWESCPGWRQRAAEDGRRALRSISPALRPQPSPDTDWHQVWFSWTPFPGISVVLRGPARLQSISSDICVSLTRKAKTHYSALQWKQKKKGRVDLVFSSLWMDFNSFAEGQPTWSSQV